MKVRARVLRIGNSLGIIIPSVKASAKGQAEGDSVEVEVSRRASVKELFGTAKFSMTAQEFKDESRAERGDRSSSLNRQPT